MFAKFDYYFFYHGSAFTKTIVQLRDTLRLVPNSIPTIEKDTNCRFSLPSL